MPQSLNRPLPSSEGASASPASGGGTAAAPKSVFSVGVERGDNGVFVYTLRDTESGKVLVVIPRGDLPAAGSQLQTKA